jgi:hypothetical protein
LLHRQDAEAEKDEGCQYDQHALANREIEDRVNHGVSLRRPVRF